MCLAQASWPKRLSLLAMVWMSSCGGKIGDDSSQVQAAGGSPPPSASGMTIYPLPGGYGAFGGAPSTGGVGELLLGGAGGNNAPFGGAPPVTSGTRTLGGGPAKGGSVSVLSGGTAATGPGGAFTIGGVFALGGKPNTGGTQPLGGTHSTTMPATGGASAVGDVCIMPPSAGECDGFIKAYYFNPFHGQCEPFIYGGCGGNANRFDSQQACEQRCSQSVCPIIIPPTSPIWVCPQNAACYYDSTTGCRCRAKDGDCITDSTCAADDAGADASTEPPDAGESTPLPVVLCTCGGASEWACRVLDLLAP